MSEELTINVKILPAEGEKLSLKLTLPPKWTEKPSAKLKPFDLIVKADGTELNGKKFSDVFRGKDAVLLDIERPPHSVHKVIVEQEEIRAGSDSVGEGKLCSEVKYK